MIYHNPAEARAKVIKCMQENLCFTARTLEEGYVITYNGIRIYNYLLEFVWGYSMKYGTKERRKYCMDSYLRSGAVLDLVDWDDSHW